MTPDDWRDRLVDRGLDEQLGGHAPPDLAANILAAAETETTSTLGDLNMSTTSKTRTFGTWALAASLLVNCGLAAVLMSSKGEQTEVTVVDDSVSTAVETERLAEALSKRIDASGSKEVPLSGETSTPSPSGNTDFDSSLDLIQSTVQTETWDEAAGESGESDSDSLVIAPYEMKPDDSAGEEMSFDEHFYADRSVRREKNMVTLPPNIRAAEADYGYSGKEAKLGGDGQMLGTGAKSDADVRVQVAVGQVLPADLSKLESEGPSQFSLDSFAEVDKSLAGEANGDGNLGLEGMEVLGRYKASLRRDFYTPLYANLGEQQDRNLATWGFQQRGEWQGRPDGEGNGPGAAGDRYERIVENPFLAAIGGDAISTFSIDVDTASYANVRQMLLSGHQPPADAVRIEELVNYFDYGYEGPVVADADAAGTPSPSPSPQGGGEIDSASPKVGGEVVPFAAHVETAACPWRPEHRLVRIGIKGREVPENQRPVSNLVFLVDVSGSMNSSEKLPLVKHGLKKLAEKLGENDRVAIVVYASSEGLVLPSTPGTEQATILGALDSLNAGGSTAGGAGIRLAYQIAEDNFIQGGTNRVILCTDGDFNVGTTDTAELERLVEQKANDTKVFLSCIGFGRGNLNDQMMEKITGIGNGNYYYADSQQEAERIFARRMTGLLVTIAKDVKIQVEFNPAKVAGYRLIGYENRMLKTQDFNDDKKDAGEIGSGHTVTCLYEVVPAGKPVDVPNVDELKYQHPAGLTDAAESDDLLTLKMRYKQPDEDVSSKLEWPIADSGHSFGQATTDLQFASAVASFGMLLRDSQFKGLSNFDAVIEIAESARGEDATGDRAEFVEIVRAAKKLMPAVVEEEAVEEPAVEKEAEASATEENSSEAAAVEEAPAGDEAPAEEAPATEASE